MVEDQLESDRGNPLPPHWQQGLFYMHRPTDRISHTTAFVTPVVDHWLSEWWKVIKVLILSITHARCFYLQLN